MVAFATQVKRRRGTQEQNDAFTGAEGEIVVDLTNMTLRVHDGRTRGGFVVGGGAGRNIGDIFFTARTDTSLNGAVEANGGQYNTTDFVGSESIGNILSAGKVPYMTIADFDTAVANNGECTSFGWDGGTVFKVPKINGRRLIRRQLPTADNNYTWYNLYSDGYVEQGGLTNVRNVVFSVEMANTNYTFSRTNGNGRGATYYAELYSTIIERTTTGFAVTLESALTPVSWQINGYAAESEYNDKSTWQYDRYMRPMVQLANGATDEAVVVAGNVLADISSIKEHLVVEFQKPTADNNYTWYRKYADGWVEQGGAITTLDSLSVVFTLPVEMATNTYSIIGNCNAYQNISGHFTPASATTTSFTAHCGAVDSTYGKGWWQVSGMAAQ